MLLLLTEVQTKVCPFQDPLLLAQVTPRGPKGSVTFDYCLHFSLVSPFRIQTLKTRTFKNSFVYRENSKVTAHAQKRAEKTLGVHTPRAGP